MMTTEPRGGVIRALYRAAGLPDPDAAGDGPLLDRFLARRDEAAFAEVVRRHGPMVLGVCRRMLGNAPDADDAFQATFLVLVRRAGGLTDRPTVGNFLYGVAVNTALKARAAAMKRRAKEAAAARPDGTPVAGPPAWLDALDAELSKLPDKYREPLVLCELEGLPRKDAAARLGVPDGTLSSRLATAKKLLADRLARKGITAPAALLTAGLAREATAAVPPALADAAVRTATVAAGHAAGVVPAAVQTLSSGVVRTMLLTKLITGAAIVLAAGLGVAGAGVALARTPDAGPPAAAEAAPAPAAPAAKPAKPPEPAWKAEFRQGLRASPRAVAQADWAAVPEVPRCKMVCERRTGYTPQQCRNALLRRRRQRGRVEVFVHDYQSKC